MAVRKWAAGLAVLAVAAGAASAVTNTSIATNERDATAASQRMLAALRLPPGASPSQGDPSGSRLSKSPTHPATPDLVDLHRFWTVPGAPHDALAWIEAHPPAGGKLSMSGASGVNGTTVSQYDGFAFLEPVRGLPAPTETLLISVTTARGGGTALRADAQTVWLFLRPRSERIPPGVRAVTIVARGLAGSSETQRTVSDRRKVRRIIALVDALPAWQPGDYACPAVYRPHVTLAFAGRRGRTLAIARADGDGCGIVNLWIHGRREHALADGPLLIKKLGSLLGANLS